MHPNEFWNARYKEIMTFCNAQAIRHKEDLKDSIYILEGATDKMIRTDSNINRRPKVIALKKMFKQLFE